MRPRAAQMRQQQSQQRRARLMESATRAQMQSGPAGRTNMAVPNGPLNRFVFTNRQQRYRDPNRGIITQAEWDQVVERHEDSGKAFRYVFGFGVLLCLLFLFFAKYDEEYNVEVPQIESGRGFAGEAFPHSRSTNDNSNKDYVNAASHANGKTGKGGASSSMETTSLAELESYYQTLGVEGRLRPLTAVNNDDDEYSKSNNNNNDNNDSRSAAWEEADKERRRENYRVRQELKRAYMQHQEQQGQLVYCGRACESRNKQVELAYTTLASQVDRELFGVLLDAKNTKSVRSTTPEQLKEKYEAKKKEIINNEHDEEDRNMALEELKDAYDIIIDPDARKYYLLYGSKPPEFLRHVNARHGGWGQEMALGTYKYRIIIMWLDFLHKYIGVWGETAVLLSVVIFILARLPNALKQVESIMDEMGLNDDDDNNNNNEKDDKNKNKVADGKHGSSDDKNGVIVSEESNNNEVTS